MVDEPRNHHLFIQAECLQIDRFDAHKLVVACTLTLNNASTTRTNGIVGIDAREQTGNSYQNIKSK